MEQNKIDFSPGYKIRNQYAIHYLTFQIVNWIDIFTRQRYRNIVIDSLKYCQENKGLKIHAYVIMSNHIHAILSSQEGRLSDVIRDFKTHTSKKIIESINEPGESRREWLLQLFKRAAEGTRRNESYQVWTHENHPIELESNHFYEQKLNYIHNNPVEAGWIEKPEDWVYSSAGDYAGIKGLLEITLIE